MKVRCTFKRRGGPQFRIPAWPLSWMDLPWIVRGTFFPYRQGSRSKRWLLELPLCSYERTSRMPLVRTPTHTRLNSFLSNSDSHISSSFFFHGHHPPCSMLFLTEDNTFAGTEQVRTNSTHVYSRLPRGLRQSNPWWDFFRWHFLRMLYGSWVHYRKSRSKNSPS